jgi:ABC-type sugar transport system, permease component
MIWTIQTSFKDNRELYQNIWGLPHQWHFENYTKAWVKANIGNYFFNSVYTTFLTAIGSFFVVSLAAYVIARFRTRTNKFLNFYFIISMMIPGSIAIIPQYFIIADLHLVNNLNGLVIKYIADSIPFSIFVLIGFYKILPVQLEEAAYMDGSGYFRTFFSIMLPLSKPGILTISIFTILGAWNEYFFALITMTDRSKYTIPVGVANLLATTQYRAEWGVVFAASVTVLLPSILVYTLFQKNITSGLTVGALKG